MLVLSRRSSEKILLPDVDASIQVLDIKGDRVRLGIEAPAELKILREELANVQSRAHGLGKTALGLKASTPSLSKEERHKLRNQLNFAAVGLALANRQLQAGMLENAQGTLDKLCEAFEELGERVESLIAPPKPAPARAAERPPTALLVEDDHNECELLAGFFRLAGYQVVTADDGTDAIDYLHGHERPDVMLLDMMLPRCDGPTTVKMVRRNPALADLKIYAVSGYTPEQVGLDRKTAGIDGWFQKPLNPEALLRELSGARAMRA